MTQERLLKAVGQRELKNSRLEAEQCTLQYIGNAFKYRTTHFKCEQLKVGLRMALSGRAHACVKPWV